MGAPGEEVRCHGILDAVAPLFQEGDVTAQGGRVAGDIDDPSGGEPGEGLDGIGIQALPGRVHDHHIRLHALFFQFQGRLARVAAEKFRVFDAVALCVVFGILNGLGDYLHADDLSGGGGHGERDGAHAAVEVQHRIFLRDLRLGDGGLIEPLGLMMVHLIERPGGEPEGEAAEGVLDVAGAVEGDELIPQDGIALFRVHGEDQRGEAGDFLQPLQQLFRLGELFTVNYKTYQHLLRYRAPADVDVAQEPLVGFLVIDRDPELVHIVHHRVLDGIGLLRENQAPLVFHHIVGPRPEEAGIGPALFGAYRILGFVPVAVAGGGGEDGEFLEGFAA